MLDRYGDLDRDMLERVIITFGSCVATARRGRDPVGCGRAPPRCSVPEESSGVPETALSIHPLTAA